MSKQNKITNKRVIFPFFKGVMFPIEELCHHFGIFLQMAGIVAFCYAAITLMLGQNYFCLFSAERSHLFCLNNVYFSLLSLLLWGILLAYFINRWHLVTKCGMSVAKALQERCWKKDFKTFCFIWAYFGLWLLVGVVIYLLKQRVATPDWKIELLYFTIGAIIILAAVILLLNSVLFIRFLQGKNWLVLKQTLLPVFDNIYKIVAYFLFYLLLFVYLLQYARLLFVTGNILPLWFAGLLGSMVNYIVVCAITVCFVASLEFQEKQIFPEENSNRK